MPKKLQIKTGDRFGRLTIVEEVDKDKSGNRRFLSRCDCGNEKILYLYSLRTGRSKSCGCSNISHGRSNHRLYQTWSSMKVRCFNPDYKTYDNYGGRGITICDSWLDIENFINDMYPSYQEGLQLDRIDNDKGYFKENCRWVTKGQNNMNTRPRKDSSSKYKGVSKKGDKWVSRIQVNGKLKHLGVFTTQEEAALTYDKAALELHGEYSNLNFKEV